MDYEKDQHVQYCNSNSVSVVNPAGRLRLVYTPFPVTQIIEGGKPKWFIVDEVKCTENDKLVYIIDGAAYFHYHFVIAVRF